ncbi:hypothetical protein WJX77_004325 [Trebouxia sp. C0004]
MPHAFVKFRAERREWNDPEQVNGYWACSFLFWCRVDKQLAFTSVYKEHIMEQILRWPFWDSLEDDMKRQWVVMMKASSRNKIPESLIPDKLVSHRLWTKFWNERATARKHAGLSRLKKEIDLGWVRMLAKPLSSESSARLKGRRAVPWSRILHKKELLLAEKLQGVHEAKLRQEALEKCLNMLMWCTGHPPMEQQPMRKLPV